MTGPLLVQAEVPEALYVDVVTERGCVAAGLPPSCPLDARGRVLAWPPCQAIGQAAWDVGHPGLACRSAARGAPPRSEELAWFQRGRTRLRALAVQRFAEWFW